MLSSVTRASWTWYKLIWLNPNVCLSAAAALAHPSWSVFYSRNSNRLMTAEFDFVFGPSSARAMKVGSYWIHELRLHLKHNFSTVLVTGESFH
jgi:hypothetical protein